jgi:proliferating cell nuclear antigen
MFKAIYPSSKDFYYLINAMSKLSDSIIINFTQEGIISRYLTDDKVLMGVLNIPKDSLEEYSIEKEISVKLDLTNLKKILGKARSSKSSLEITETDAGIKIIIIDDKSGTRSNIYVKGEKGEIQSLKEPNVSLTVSATLSGDILKTIIDDSEEISEEAEFSAENDCIKINVEESGKTYTALLRKDKPLNDLEIEKPSKSIYSLEVLKTVASASNFSDNLKLGFGTNLPMKVEATGEKGALLSFWIAPRM